jgi:hypothetical protein
MPAASTKSSWRRQATEEQSHNAAAGRRALRGLGDFVGVAPTVPPRECAARTAAPGGGRGSRAGQTADERERCHRLCRAVPRRPSHPGGGDGRVFCPRRVQRRRSGRVPPSERRVELPRLSAGRLGREVALLLTTSSGIVRSAAFLRRSAPRFSGSANRARPRGSQRRSRVGCSVARRARAMTSSPRRWATAASFAPPSATGSSCPYYRGLARGVSFSIRRLRAAVRLVHGLPNEAKTLGKLSFRPTAWSVFTEIIRE